MVNSLFYSRVKDRILEHREDKSKAAIALKSYMSYLKDDDNQHDAKNKKIKSSTANQ